MMLKILAKTPPKFWKELGKEAVKGIVSTFAVEGVKAGLEIWKKRKILEDDIRLKAEAKEAEKASENPGK